MSTTPLPLRTRLANLTQELGRLDPQVAFTLDFGQDRLWVSWLDGPPTEPVLAAVARAGIVATPLRSLSPDLFAAVVLVVALDTGPQAPHATVQLRRDVDDAFAQHTRADFTAAQLDWAGLLARATGVTAPVDRHQLGPLSVSITGRVLDYLAAAGGAQCWVAAAEAVLTPAGG